MNNYSEVKHCESHVTSQRLFHSLVKVISRFILEKYISGFRSLQSIEQNVQNKACVQGLRSAMLQGKFTR